MAKDEEVPLHQNPTHRVIQEILLKYGILPKIARGRAQIDLRNFTPDELLASFGKLRRYGPNLKTFDFNSTTSWVSDFANLFIKPKEKAGTWLKPSLELVKESANKRLALCINAAGEWSLRENDYFALSHVWIEGIQADPENRGIPLAHVQQILKRIEATGAKWIWLDGLAIPATSEALTFEEEELKIAIINNLDQIYRRAESIIILDALVMQLQSTDLVEVAVCLACGKWMTRVWTFQEIYLAKKALIMTGTGIVDYHTMCARLRSLSGIDDECPNIYASMSSSSLEAVYSAKKDEAKFKKLYLTLARLLGVEGERPALDQIAMSCTDRITGNDIDYARAFFPVLGLTWKSSLSREEGMELIYNSEIDFAKRLVLMHGSPKSGFRPGWAPSYLTGLKGRPLGPEEPLGDIGWEQRGLKRRWYNYKVVAQHPFHRDDGLILEIDDEEKGVKCGCFTSGKERAETIGGFQKAIARKCAYILMNEQLRDPSPNGLAYNAMLVERNDDVSDMDEAWVYMTVEAVPLGNSLLGDPLPWLLLHESPISDHNRSGKGFSKVARLLSDEEALHKGKTSLHEAAERGDEDLMRKLLSTNKAMITARDQRGWTPLHAAAHKGKTESVLMLVHHGAPVDVEDSSERSALMIAADEGHTETVQQLLRLGANVNLSNHNALCPLNQALLRSHVSTVEVLLAAGANPNGRDNFGFAPLLVASGKDIKLANLLISAGADPSADLVGGSTCLHFASRAGNVPLIERLLELGMAVDLTEGNIPNGYTALCRSVEEQHPPAVSTLLQRGANPNHAIETSWTPIMLAAKLGNYEITKMLLEYGADTATICQPEGWTALHIASQEGRRLVVRLLLNAGQNINARDSSGSTPFQLADAAGHNAVVEILRKAGGV